MLIPPNGKKKTVKDQIVQILSRQWPLSAKKIHNIVKKNKSVSYQAIHKALKQLLKEDVIKRNKNNSKKYQLKMKWIKNVKQYAGNVESHYKSTLPKTKTFDSFAEMDDYIMKLFKKEFVGKKIKSKCYSYWRHAWWPLFLDRKHYSILKDIKNKENFYIAVNKSTEVEKWCKKFYDKNNMKFKTGVEAITPYDFIILGNRIIQFIWPEKITKEADKTFNNIENIQDLDLDQFYENLFKKKTKIDMITLKNENLAGKLGGSVKNLLQ